MASVAYPLLRPKRRRHVRLPKVPPRLPALVLLALLALVAGVTLARRATRPDTAKLLADATATF